MLIKGIVVLIVEVAPVVGVQAQVKVATPQVVVKVLQVVEEVLVNNVVGRTQMVR
jgi:hypothetical protein